MSSVAEIFGLRYGTECFAAETSERIVEQIVRGKRGIEADGARGLHDLRVGSRGHSVHRRSWGWFFGLSGRGVAKGGA